MLHMIVAAHSPETCPLVNQALAKKVLAASQRTNDVAKKLGVTIHGAWTCMPGHMHFMLVDAPNAHVVNQMALETELITWNTATIYPVVTMQEAMSHVK